MIPSGVFRFFLVDADEQVVDPSRLRDGDPELERWRGLHGRVRQAVRILEIRTEIREELVEPGFNGEFVVEPV